MSNTSPPVDRLVSVLEHAISQLDEEAYLFFFDINKLLYYLEKRLDDDNELKSALTFYWYEDGPVAAIAQNVADRSQEVGVLSKEGTPHGQKFRAAGGTIAVTDDDELRDAKAAIESVLSDDYVITETHEEKLAHVYQDAPFEFQRQFKLEVLHDISLLDQAWGLSPESVYETVSFAEAYLPLDGSFREVNDLYSQFVDLSRDLLAEEDSVSSDAAEAYQDLAMQFWKVFCAKLRIETASNDFDSEQVSRWATISDERVDNFRNAMREFDAQFVESGSRKPPARAAENSPWGRVAESIINESD